MSIYVPKSGNSTWSNENNRFLSLERTVQIPNGCLRGVSRVALDSPQDFNSIPDSGGCYWIWTDEHVIHSMHNRVIPNKFDGGRVIYNGLAKDNLRLRISYHLRSEHDATWSGISMDIFMGRSKSHRKRTFGKGSFKVPFIIGTPIMSKHNLLKLRFTKTEQNYIVASHGAIFFRNGIDIFDHKHRRFKYKVYFIADLNSVSYLNFIEHEWRLKFGSPQLNSYISGR
jgi:hypothetical protein